MLNSDWEAMLGVAFDDEEPVIRAVALRAGVLWTCRSCGGYRVTDDAICEQCGRSVEDTCDAGDYDATPQRSDECCADGVVGAPYLCTRSTGHDGQHVAGDGRRVVAVWKTGDVVSRAPLVTGHAECPGDSGAIAESLDDQKESDHIGSDIPSNGPE